MKFSWTLVGGGQEDLRRMDLNSAFWSLQFFLWNCKHALGLPCAVWLSGSTVFSGASVRGVRLSAAW